MSDWYWVLLFAVAGVSFLVGRWRGIRDFEKKLDEIEAIRDEEARKTH